MVKDPINIAFITDKNYMLCTSVALQSLKVNRSLRRCYNIFIVYEGLGAKDIHQFESVTDSNFVVQCINAAKKVGRSRFSSINFARHVSSAATYKFNLTRILSDVDKLLYLDGDLLIRDSLEELYDIDLGEAYAAVCQDMGAETYPENYRKRLGINHRYYFNSGVMLLNLKRLRDEKIHSKLISYRKNGINDYMDQDAFNVVFKENVIYFDITYNMATPCWTKYGTDEINSYYNSSFKFRSECYHQAKILHLATPEKPWLYFDVIGSEEWFMYYLDSPLCSSDFSRRAFGNSRYKGLIAADTDYFSMVSAIQPIVSHNRSIDPVISVIIPVYNSEKYLTECLESLLLQTLTEAEYIFIDDSSEDSSAHIVEFYSRIDSRVKLMHQSHGFAGKARNLGIKNSKGKYITFLDSDDLFMPNALKELYKCAASMNADIAVCECLIFSTDKSDTRKSDSSLKQVYLPVEKAFSADTYSDYLFQFTDGPTWGKIFLRDFIVKNNIVFPELPRSEDIPFTYTALALAERITYTKQELVLHRFIEDSNSLEAAKDKNPTTVSNALCILWDRLKNEGMADKLYKTFINKVVTSYYYNFTTMRTLEGFSSLYKDYKTTLEQFFTIPFDEDDFFCESSKVEYLRLLYESSDLQECLFKLTSRPRNEIRREGQKVNTDVYPMQTQNTLLQKWLPPIVQGGIQCLRDNGVKYTIIRTFEHISGRA